MNEVTLIGNVVRDVELKTYDGSETKGSYVRFTLAINEYNYKNNENNAIFKYCCLLTNRQKGFTRI